MFSLLHYDFTDYPHFDEVDEAWGTWPSRELGLSSMLKKKHEKDTFVLILWDADRRKVWMHFDFGFSWSVLIFQRPIWFEPLARKLQASSNSWMPGGVSRLWECFRHCVLLPVTKHVFFSQTQHDSACLAKQRNRHDLINGSWRRDVFEMVYQNYWAVLGR